MANAAIVPAGTGGEITRLPQQRHRSGHRHQRLLRRQRDRRTVALSRGAVPRDRHAQVGNGQPFTGHVESAGGCGRQRVRVPSYRAGICLQRDGGAVAELGLPDAVAGQRRPARGLDLECRRRLDHLEHGDRSQLNGKIDAYATGTDAADPGHLQLLRAVDSRTFRQRSSDEHTGTRRKPL